MNKIHNLDESVSEYFDFIVKGHTYRFRHLNTEEFKELMLLEDKEDSEVQTTEFLKQFITPVSEAAPSFEEIYKKMTIPHLRRFTQMIKEEFGANAGIQS